MTGVQPWCPVSFKVIYRHAFPNRCRMCLAGILNLMMLILVAANARLIVENLLKCAACSASALIFCTWVVRQAGDRAFS